MTNYGIPEQSYPETNSGCNIFGNSGDTGTQLLLRRPRSGSPCLGRRIPLQAHTRSSTPTLVRRRPLSVTRALCDSTSAHIPVNNTTAVDTIQKQLAVHEERVAVLLEKYENDSRLRESSIARLEEKASSQLTHEKRYAELAGTVRGLTDVAEHQIRRIQKNEEQFQDRTQSFKNQLEGQIREDKSASDNSTKEILSKQRSLEASFEEISRKYNQRLQRLEDECIASIHKRLEVMEASSESNKESSTKDDVTTRVTVFESRLGELTVNVEKTLQESSDVCARMSATEQHVKTLRTLLDARDDQSHWLYDRLEKLARDILEQGEKINLVSTQLSEIYQEFRSPGGRGVGKPEHSDSSGEMSDSRRDILPSSAASAADAMVKQCLTEVEECKTRIAQLSSDLSAANVDNKLAQHLSTLVQQLQDLKPKFIQHETDIKNLYAKSAKQSKETASKFEEMCAKHDEQVRRLTYVLERFRCIGDELPTGEQGGRAENETEEELQALLLSGRANHLTQIHRP